MTSDDSARSMRDLVPGLLRNLTRAVIWNPILTLCLASIVCGLCVAYTINSLKFKTERADLIDPRADYHERWLSFTDEFGDQNDIVVVVESDDKRQIEAALEAIGGRVAAETELFQNVLYKIETGELREKGLQYLSPAQLEALLDRMNDFAPILKGNWDRCNLKTLYYGLNRQLDWSDGDQKEQARGEVVALTDRVTHSLASFMANPDAYESPWENLVTLNASQSDEAGRTRYSLDGSGRFGFVAAQPKSKAGFSGATPAIAKIRAIVDAARTEFPECRLGVTGIPVLEADEMQSTQESMLIASIISFVGVWLLLTLGFRGLRHPLIAVGMLLVGTIWSFGFTTFAVGHLNILSVSFVTILLGLGIDFAIVYLSQYLVERSEGRDLETALEETSARVGPGIFTASITTTLAFLCAMFTDFLGIAELGIIAGGGILLCVAAAFTVLPALLALFDRGVRTESLPVPFQGTTMRYTISRYPAFIVAAGLLLIAVCGMKGFGVRYDDNLMNLQAEGLESVEVQERMVHASNNGVLFAVSLADSPAEAIELKKKFEALPTVHHVTEIASFLPAHASHETHLMVQAIEVLLSHLPDQPPPVPMGEPDAVLKWMAELQGRLADMPGAEATSLLLQQTLAQLSRIPAEQQVQLITGFQYRLSADLYYRMRGLAGAAKSEPVGIGDLPPALASRFVGQPHGNRPPRWLLQVHPKGEIWGSTPLEKFLADIRTVDPNVTGTPVQNYEASRQIRQSYQTVALYSLLAVGLVLLIDFMAFRDTLFALLAPLSVVVVTATLARLLGWPLTAQHLVAIYVGLVIGLAGLFDFAGLRNTLLALLPPVAGAGIMMGLLGFLGQDLNPANLIVLPLIVGIGVDNGVHVIHDALHQRRRYRMSASIINAMLLTSATTILGFGSMCWPHVANFALSLWRLAGGTAEPIVAHRGLNSLGLVLSIGVGSCLFVSVIMLPAILTLISRRKRPRRDAGVDAAAAPANDGVKLSVFYPESAA